MHKLSSLKPNVQADPLFNRLLEMSHKRNILVFAADLPGSIDGHFYYDPEYRIILLDCNKLKEPEKKEYVLAYLLGCSFKKVDKAADRFAVKLLNIMKGAYKCGQQHE